MYDPENLSSLGAGDLKDIYIELFHINPPARSRKGFLLGNIYWAMQAKAQGKGFKVLREKLVSHASNQTTPVKTQYLTGTRIIREWRGVTHEVIVEDTGFRWQQQTFKSLSHIAREITGTRWSGPRFFGLTTTKEAIDD